MCEWLSEYEQEIISCGVPNDPWFSRGKEYNRFSYLRKILDERVGDAPAPVEDIRTRLVRKYSFAIPNLPALQAIRSCGPVLEVGVGTDYWAYELNKSGADVVATDRLPFTGSQDTAPYRFNRLWTDVLVMDGVTALEAFPDRTLFLCWPSYDEPWAAGVLAAYRGTTFVYVGEGPGGCCADDAFFALLESGWEEADEVRIPVWCGIHDYLTVYKRK